MIASLLLLSINGPTANAACVGGARFETVSGFPLDYCPKYCSLEWRPSQVGVWESFVFEDASEGCYVCDCTPLDHPSTGDMSSPMIGGQTTRIKSRTSGGAVSDIVTDSRGEDVFIDSVTAGRRDGQAVTRIRGKGGVDLRNRNTAEDPESLAFSDLSWNNVNGGRTIIDSENRAEGGGQAWNIEDYRNNGGIQFSRNRNRASDGGVAINDISDENFGGSSRVDSDNWADGFGSRSENTVRGRTLRGGSSDNIFTTRAFEGRRAKSDVRFTAAPGEDVELDWETDNSENVLKHNWSERDYRNRDRTWNRIERESRRPRRSFPRRTGSTRGSRSSRTPRRGRRD